MKRAVRGLLSAALAAAACKHAMPARVYDTVPVARRDITVSATATGVIQTLLTLSVKSKASGEILTEPVQTGDEVKQGQLLATIDPRIPQDNLDAAQASLTVAKAQLENASAGLKRAQALFATQTITEAGLDSAKLAEATASAAVVTATANLETAQDAMEDTHVRAPSPGTILELDAVLGTVISSPTNDVGGGSVILKMANLDTVQVSALVDETDVGKVQPDQAVTITVDAFPTGAFAGRVLKIEPQAQVSQNVTMFPVEVNILNPGHLLKPGMDTEVEIHLGQRTGVLAVPNAALRTPQDVASAAAALGLDSMAVRRELAAAPAPLPPDTARAGATFTTPSGRTITLPPGVTPDQVRAAFAKRFSGTPLTPAEQALLERVRAQFQQTASGGAAGATSPASAPGHYSVFALRNGRITAVPILTGLTDQDYIEIVGGLTERDTVLLLTGGSR
ncbi:MAG TPA: efflux RND transporter periplasmic adaptor subunit [Gemmatimonadales bacterium]|nr:efflux RND transporter periplasmic adaptor subunit [Gemmatimonadales bacterium]